MYYTEHEMFTRSEFLHAFLDCLLTDIFTPVIIIIAPIVVIATIILWRNNSQEYRVGQSRPVYFPL